MSPQNTSSSTTQAAKTQSKNTKITRRTLLISAGALGITGAGTLWWTNTPHYPNEQHQHIADTIKNITDIGDDNNQTQQYYGPYVAHHAPECRRPRLCIHYSWRNHQLACSQPPLLCLSRPTRRHLRVPRPQTPAPHYLRRDRWARALHHQHRHHLHTSVNK